MEDNNNNNNSHSSSSTQLIQLRAKSKNKRVQRALKKKEPKLVENVKNALFVKGSTSNQLLNDLVSDLVSWFSPHLQLIPQFFLIITFVGGLGYPVGFILFVGSIIDLFLFIDSSPFPIYSVYSIFSNNPMPNIYGRAPIRLGRLRMPPL